MKIFFFSDFQGEKMIPEGTPDLVVLLGDIYHTDAKEIDAMYDCPKVGVYGNHDAQTEWSSTKIKVIHGETFEFEGVTFAGFGGCPRYNRKPNQFDEPECAAFMDSLDKVDIFIAHSNPKYAESNFKIDPHRGFYSFNEYIFKKQPRYFFHGHLHAPSLKKANETWVRCVFPFFEFDFEK